MSALAAVLKWLKEAGLTAKPSKCHFGMDECTYLGHIVGNGQVRPEKGKFAAVEAFPVPKTKKDVRAFLGLTGYYRKFIPKYATLAAPLTELTKKQQPNCLVWNAECAEAFEALKRHLCTSPVLKCPDFECPFVLLTDASNWGVGAVLSQVDDADNEHPVAYFSKKLLPRERRYSTIEKECLAIKLATHAFRVYLLGKPFTVQTDHHALEWLDRLKEDNTRLTRWSLAVSVHGEVSARKAQRQCRCLIATSQLVAGRRVEECKGLGTLTRSYVINYCIHNTMLKTALGGTIQQNRKSDPCSWTPTENYLEKPLVDFL